VKSLIQQKVEEIGGKEEDFTCSFERNNRFVSKAPHFQVLMLIFKMKKLICMETYAAKSRIMFIM
jgi:hypothetical protein